jgi:hypothetical protein
MLAGVVAPQAEVRSGPEQLIHSDELIDRRHMRDNSRL